MRIEVVTTGSELLLGNTINTHLAFLGRALFPLGLRIARQTAVPDGEAIRGALQDACKEGEIILVTGGLGPTTDDLTREITAELLGQPLEFNAEVLASIEARFARRGLQVNERVKRQTMVPAGATVLINSNGTAPGLYLQFEGRHVFLLPGPPREMQPMFTGQVIPLLRQLLPEGPVPECRLWRVARLGESEVERLVGEEILAIPGIELGYCARSGEVEVRCIGRADAVEAAGRIVREKLKANIITDDDRHIEQVVVAQLIAGSKTVAVAESCTGGALAHRITNVAGASAVFLAGYVTYANAAKSSALGVDPRLIEEHGAVSAEVARAMAEGARRAAGADYALSTTGIAGPGGGTPEKPVGTVFVGIAGENGARVQRLAFPTDRETFKTLVTQSALDLLRRELLGVDAND